VASRSRGLLISTAEKTPINITTRLATSTSTIEVEGAHAGARSGVVPFSALSGRGPATSRETRLAEASLQVPGLVFVKHRCRRTRNFLRSTTRSRNRLKAKAAQSSFDRAEGDLHKEFIDLVRQEGDSSIPMTSH